MLACCLREGILSDVVIEAWLCVLPLLEFMRLLMVLCNLDGFVLKSSVSWKASQFSVCFCASLVFISMFRSCMRFVVIRVCGVGVLRKLFRSLMSLFMSGVKFGL